MTDSLKIDLHIHSTASDGTYSPCEVARKAKAAGLCAAALTDHDTISGVAGFLDECEKIGIEGISGVEISARFSKEMHIIGLYVDGNDEAFKAKLENLRKAREIRNKKMLKLLRENGFDITESDIISEENGQTLSSTGRAHIARAMLNKGYVKSVNEAFVKYLKKGNCCYVERITYSPCESIEMIKSAGGLAILAHPIFISEDYDSLYPILKELKSYGLDGVECYYNCYSEKFSKTCKKICLELNLLMSGGSDFHGDNKPDIEIGSVSEGYVPYGVLQEMKARKGSIG